MTKGVTLIEEQNQLFWKKGRILSDLYDLVNVMKRLRGEDGCPWDREQTHESLKPYLIEEVYEVFDAIDRKNDVELKEELGDLLLQIVFHAQLASEERRFTIDDVAGAIVTKLKRRHPHVFGGVQVENADEVLQNWEAIKKKEGKVSVLDGVPKELPALLKARRIQEKVRRVGFDWEAPEPVFEKVIEEVAELKEAVAEGDRSLIEEEFGDILFSLVNVSRFLKIDAEEALRQTVNKFEKRFRFIEKSINEKGGKPIQEYSLRELEDLWEESKNGRK
jgi:tetrapyrrole methylase family protein/MazG family protein